MNMFTVLVDAPLKSEDFISKLIPNWVSFVAQVLATLVLITVVIIFAYKPVKKIINKRQEHIMENIKEAEQANADAKVNKTNAEEMVIASIKKSDEIIAEAKKQAEVVKVDMINEASKTVEKMKNDAQNDIEKAKEEAKEEVRQEMIDVALLASSEILKRNVSDDDNQKLADEFIKDITK